MLSLTGLQPQCTLSLGHLAAVWNTLRTHTTTSSSGSGSLAARHRHAASAAAAAAASKSTVTLSSQESITTQDAQHAIRSVFGELGFDHLSQNVRVEKLSPMLDTKLEALATNWGESYTSAESFFENKYGMTEQELHSSSFCGDESSRHFRITGLPNASSLLKSFNGLHTSSRGFKTRRSGRGGLGMHTDDDNFSTLKYLRQSVFEKVNTPPGSSIRRQPNYASPSSSSTSSSPSKRLLHEQESSPEVQEKLKIAFAEGYSASDHRKDGEGGSAGGASVWARKAVRFAWYGLLVWLAFQLLQGYSAFGGNVKINVLKGERFEINPENITVKFDDVKGVDEAKGELIDVVDFLRDPQKFQALGAKLPKGVLLVGPPGIGKTLLARAVAGEAEVPFFHASGSEFDEIFVGTGAKRIRQLFDAAKARAPCVIFIDEIDTVGAKRTSSQIHPYANQTINQLLSEMDGFQQNEGVIVLGATNRRDNLDKALLRPGRFDVEVRVFAPDLKGRCDILDLYLKRVKRGPDINVSKIARGTTGCTGADLENMVNQAALKAAKDGGSVVSMAHMEYAKDKVLMGPAKKTRIQDEETNLCTAYHEAGHTLVAYYTKDATALHKVTIVPRGLSLGHTSFVPEKEQYNMTRSQLLAQMDVAMGGRVAEELISGMDQVTTGASSDFQTATAIATAMVKKFGMSEKVGVRVISDEEVEGGLQFMKINELSASTSELVDSEIKRLLQESYDRAKTILRNHSTEHKALAQALMKYETLDAEDINAIVEGKKFPKLSQATL